MTITPAATLSSGARSAGELLAEAFEAMGRASQQPAQVAGIQQCWRC